MIYHIFYGEISDDRQKNRDNGDDDPFSVLKRNIDISVNWLEFLNWAKKHLSEEIKIDWGSFAWKGTGNDIKQLKKDKPYEVIEEYRKIDPEKIYGVVFIEMS